MKIECGNCKYFKSQTNLLTGKPKKNRPGECIYVVEWPKVPMGYDRLPYRSSSVWHDSNAESCACFYRIGVPNG